MFDSEVAVKQLSAAVDPLLELDLPHLDRDQLLDLLRGLEAQRRRLPVLDHALIAELDQRGVAGEPGRGQAWAEDMPTRQARRAEGKPGRRQARARRRASWPAQARHTEGDHAGR